MLKRLRRHLQNYSLTAECAVNDLRKARLVRCALPNPRSLHTK